MKRLGTLALAVILITGYNAMKPKIEETELLPSGIASHHARMALHNRV